jgi:predicted nucleotidyltransferase
MNQNEEIPFGIKSITLSKIVELFQKHPCINEVILYGSRAKGNYRPGSDIDLCLVGESIEDTVLTQIDNELDELLLPYQFDVSVRDKILDQALLDHISRVGKIIFSRTPLQK